MGKCENPKLHASEDPIANEATDGRCTADFGQSKPCCGQIDTREVPQVVSCPENKSTCFGYKLGAAMGKCEKPKLHASKDPEKWLYVLHVRRSDTVYQCDTSLQAVMNYMRCPTARGTEAANHTLLLFTDERNQLYINSLLTSLAKLPRWGGGVVHGDKMVLELLDGPDRADNYLVYSVASLLMSRADQFFAMERCSGKQDCGNVRPVTIRG